MRRFKNTFFYIFIMGGFSLLMYRIIRLGKSLEQNRNIILSTGASDPWIEFLHSITHNIEHPLAILLAQIFIIMICARFFGFLFQKIGQPIVIGEIVAGIVLGPSLVGMYFPEFTLLLFPKETLGNLQFLSQIGLILFMFIIGMELDLKVLKNKAHDAVVISHASIVIPFTLGIGLAYFIYDSYAPPSVQFSSFGLFLGISMSITAFPVLARIIQERKMSKTKLGTLIITCAAADDITAWSLLAAVIAIVKAGSFISSLYTIALAIIYVLIMIKIIGPFLNRIGNLYFTKESLSKPLVAIFFITLIISSYSTEIIGIHALFGAFMAGVIMPNNDKFRNIFIEKLEDVSLILLLPLFFAFTGLRTEIGLLNTSKLWMVTFFIILVAVTGKFIGSAMTAKFVGQNWKESLTIGALMNTRGLMELIVLNIGYDLGVISSEIFAMMVIMALLTTFMAGPILSLLDKLIKEEPDTLTISENSNSVSTNNNILISFANPIRGKNLFKLANAIIFKKDNNYSITAMHLAHNNELHTYNADEYEKNSFEPLLTESQKINEKVKVIFKISNDINSDIIEFTNCGAYHLVLIGIGQSIYEGSLLGKIFNYTGKVLQPKKVFQVFFGKKISDIYPFDERTAYLISKAKIPMGILIDRELQKIEKVSIMYWDIQDSFLLKYAKQFSENKIHVTLIHVLQDEAYKEESFSFPESVNHIESISIEHGTTISFNQYDIVVISLSTWKKLSALKHGWLVQFPSVLILT
jgi:Kef-type K+ transport system membrane component KefB